MEEQIGGVDGSHSARELVKVEVSSQIERGVERRNYIKENKTLPNISRGVKQLNSSQFDTLKFSTLWKIKQFQSSQEEISFQFSIQTRRNVPESETSARRQEILVT